MTNTVFGRGHGDVGEYRTDDVRGERRPFSVLQLKPWLSEKLKKSNYIWQSRVQEASLPKVLTGNDVIIQSKSGTGKTLVFTLAVLEHLREDIDRLQALILAPTREIAIQAHQTLNTLGEGHVRSSLVIGGTSLVQNKRELKRKRPHVVIGTPGRILDLYSRGDLSASTIEQLVLVEVLKIFVKLFSIFFVNFFSNFS